MYTSFDTSSLRDYVLLPPAKFRGTQLVILVQLLSIHYKNHEALPSVQYHDCVAVPG